MTNNQRILDLTKAKELVLEQGYSCAFYRGQRLFSTFNHQNFHGVYSKIIPLGKKTPDIFSR